MFARVGQRVTLLLAFVFMVATLGPALAQQDEGFRVVRLSYSTGWDALPVVVAEERGFFTKERLIVSGVAAQSASAVAQSLQANSTDVAVLPQRAFLAMAAAGAKSKVIAVNSWGTQMQLIAAKGSNISDVKDLRGKTVALGRGSGALPFLMRLLNLAGLSPENVKVAELSASDLAKALPNGTADAIFDMGHITGPIVAADRGKVVMDSKSVQKSLGAIGAMPVVASQRFVEREPEVAQRVVNAWLAAQRYIHENPDDAARLLRIFLHRHGVTTTPELASGWIGLQRYDKLHKWSENAIKDAEYNAWGLKQAGMIDKVPDIDPYIDNRFVDQALKQVATN